MITQLGIRNFRSIEQADIQLGRINVFYGPTASGKSSVLYALLVLKNFVADPNRRADGLFDLGFVNLGGFQACVFDHQRDRRVLVACAVESGPNQAGYHVGLGENDALLELRAAGPDLETLLGTPDFILRAEVSLPYPVNQNFSKQVGDLTVNWNGIAASIAAPPELKPDADKLAKLLNEPLGAIQKLDIAPQRRGFYKPSYTPTPLSPIPTTEDEVASVVLSDEYLPGRISGCLEKILGRDFRLQVPLGTHAAFFQTTEKTGRTPVPILLVNDGYGVNQVIYMLVKLLAHPGGTVLIEEPEVHLHPTIVRKFARELCSIANERDNQILLTTHSEVFLTAMLTVVAEGNLRPEDLHVYFCTKEGPASKFERQEVNEKGQVTGGLRGFIEAELEDLKKLLGI
jgi:hypothetical protein